MVPDADRLIDNIMAKIAFLGIGLMGSQMAAGLRSAGHDVRAWNRTSSKTDEWAKDGGRACHSPAEAARDADAVHLMVSNDEAVEAALSGPSGALSALPRGAFVVDHSTVSVKGVAARAERIERDGWRYIHAPVMAGPANIVKREGLMFVGARREVYDAWAPTLHQIVERHWYLGERAHEAAAFKLMANLMLVHNVDALAEFFALGQACGIEPTRAVQFFENYDPGTPVRMRAPRMARGDYSAAFTLRMAAKDVQLMIHAAREGRAGLPALETIRERMLRMIKSGRGDLDLGALGFEVMHTRELSPNAVGEG